MQWGRTGHRLLNQFAPRSALSWIGRDTQRIERRRVDHIQIGCLLYAHHRSVSLGVLE